MAKIQDLLTAGRSEPVSVCEVIKVELAPYIGERVALNCEDLVIEAAAGVNLSLIVHELLTNALKYGALSVLGGHLEVSCRDAEGGAALVWTETTMAPLHDIGAPGFGAQLINRLVRALRGVMTADWRSTGLRVVVTFKATPGLPETGERQARPTADD